MRHFDLMVASLFKGVFSAVILVYGRAEPRSVPSRESPEFGADPNTIRAHAFAYLKVYSPLWAAELVALKMTVSRWLHSRKSFTCSK
jgi:hypothetical protein